jgi:hypothetical protein
MTEELRCHRCGLALIEELAVWLVWNMDDNTYHESDEEIPVEHNGGGFPFGETCANRAMKEGVVE